MLIAARFDRALFVGDPGQLDPFSVIETPRWIGLPYDPMQNAVTVLLAHNPDLPRSPAPRVLAAPRLRSPRSCPARSTRSPASEPPPPRHPASGLHRSRDTQPAPTPPWSMAARSGLGTARAARPAHDPHRRRGSRSGRRRWQPGYWPAGPSAPASGTQAVSRSARRTSRSESPTATRPTRSARPSRSAAPPAAADDQGRHRQPPAGRRIRRHHRRSPAVRTTRRDSFHLEAGRLCVLASRHRHACIVVARAGIADLLDAHPSDRARPPRRPAQFPDGWEANHAMLAHLARHRVQA